MLNKRNVQTKRKTGHRKATLWTRGGVEPATPLRKTRPAARNCLKERGPLKAAGPSRATA